MNLLSVFLAASAGILGQVIEGTVVDVTTGLPIREATVLIDSAGRTIYQVTTDDRGVFRIQPVKNGSYTASFRHSEFVPLPQDSTRSEFTISAVSDRISLQGRLTPLSKVSGHVFDSSGRPVAGSELLLDGSQSGQTTTSDDQGNFVFRAKPGAYVLSARPPENSKPILTQDQERRGLVHTYHPGVLDRDAATKITVRAGIDSLGQDIELRTTPLRRVRGTVLDSRGNPAPKVPVQAARTDELLPHEIHAVSQEDGSFEFPSVPEGEWRVFAQTGDAKLRASALARVGAQDVDRVDLNLTAPFTLGGSVSLAGAGDGKAANPRPVGIFLKPLVAGTEGLSQGSADRDGSFQINSVYPGVYKIVAVTPGPPYFLSSISLGGRQVLGQYVELASGTAPVSIVFESEGGGLRGTVDHCAGATVVLAPQDSVLQEPQFVFTTRCADGERFEFTSVRPGDYYAFAFYQWDGPAELLSGMNQTLINQAIRLRVERGRTDSVDLRVTALNP